MKTKSYSNFEEFSQEALKSEELPTIVGGIEKEDNLSLFSEFEDEEDNPVV